MVEKSLILRDFKSSLRVFSKKLKAHKECHLILSNLPEGQIFIFLFRKEKASLSVYLNLVPLNWVPINRRVAMVWRIGPRA